MHSLTWWWGERKIEDVMAKMRAKKETKNAKTKKITIDDLAVLIKKGSDEIDTLAIMVKNGFDDMASRMLSKEEACVQFNQIDQRFEKIEGRLDRMDAKIERMDGRLDHMDARMAHIERDVEEIRRNFVYRSEFEDLMGRVKYVEVKMGINSGK